MKINQAIRLLALTAGLCAPVAQAANGTWTNLAGGSWTNTANWSGGTVAGGAGFLANFSTLNLAANATVTLDGPKTIGNLSFSDTTATFFNWIVNTGSGGPLTLAVSSGSPTITITNGQATINAVISGTNGLTKAGAGILVLTAANLFSNNVTLTAGTLNINSDAALGAVSNAITFNGGTLQVPASTTVTLDAARSNICNSTFAARYNVGDASTLTVPGIVQCSATTNSNIVKTGPGTLILSGGMGDSVTPLFNVSAGKVSVQGGTWFIQTPQTDGFYFRVAGGATYEQTGGIMNAPFYAVLSQDTPNANTSTGIFSGGTFNAPGELMVGRKNSAVMTVSGSAVLNLNQLKLGESATYTTTCNLDGGTIACNSVAKRGTATPLTSILNLNGGTLQAKSNNSFFIGGAATTFLTKVNVKSGGAIIDSQGFAITIPQALEHDAGLGATPDGGLTKLGSGTLTLSGTNTYTGNTTISAGTLLVNGSLAGGVVIKGGRLGGSGVIGGAVTVGSGSTLQPGANASAIGTLTLNNLTLASGSTLGLDIDPLGASGTNLIQTRDLAVSGPVVISFPIPANGSFTQSRYVIMTYSASASGLANLSLPPSFEGARYALAIDITTPGEVAIIVGNLSGLSVPSLTLDRSAPNEITLSWTNPSFKLQWQANGLIPANWLDYPGEAASPVTVPITTDIPSAFFRLAPEVDPNTLTGKLMMGYQGWFAAPGDGSANNRWVHWFRNNNPAATNATFDIWPDTSELDADELFDTSLTYANGSPAKLFSAYKQKTVVRHFKWMQENHLDGVFFQRFLTDLPGGNLSALRNQVAVNVRVGAETHGRVFAIMYDISGYPANTLISKLSNDWLYLVNTQRVTDSPAYLRHKGKPVVAIWGFGYSDRDDTPAQAQEAIAWFKAAGCTVMGGVPAGWRTLGTAGSDTDPAWNSAFRAFDVICPWSVGSYKNNFEADFYRSNYTVPDLAECTSNGIDYLPVIFPGFSWANLKSTSVPPPPYNQIPRNGGNFYWRQAYNAVRSGCTMMYGAMFDEVDEGTAMFKMAPTAAQLPAQGNFVPLDVDGYNLGSDWYLRLADQAGRMLRGEIPQSSTIPITPP